MLFGICSGAKLIYTIVWIQPYMQNRFEITSGVYTCRKCGRPARETGDGESGVRLCRMCHEHECRISKFRDGQTDLRVQRNSKAGWYWAISDDVKSGFSTSRAAIEDVKSYYEIGMTVEEIAESLGVPLDNGPRVWQKSSTGVYHSGACGGKMKLHGPELTLSEVMAIPNVKVCRKCRPRGC